MIYVGNAGSAVLGIDVGDLDNDGRPDIVSGDSGKNIFVWKNDGSPFTGTWPVYLGIGNAGGAAHEVVVGDMDDDGWPDIVSGDTGARIYIWENDQTPFVGLWAGTDIGYAGDAIYSMAIGDLDNDGRLDIAAGDSTDRVSVWENDGTPFVGAWPGGDIGDAEGIAYDIPGGMIYDIEIDDMDNDGDPDIVSADGGVCPYAVGNVVVWENDETPFIGPWTGISIGDAGAGVGSIVVTDPDNDGDPDIVSGDMAADIYGWENPIIHGNTASGNGVDLSAAIDDSRAVVSGDRNNDGHPDVIVGKFGEPDVVYLGGGDGTFSTVAAPGWGAGVTDTTSLAVGHLDHDGNPDFVVGIESSPDTVWLGNGDGTFTQVSAPGWALPTATRSLVVDDLNNDGDQDVVSGIYYSPDTVWLGNGDGTFTPVDIPGWAGDRIAQRFVAGTGYNINYVELFQAAGGDLVGDIRIETDSGGSPSGTLAGVNSYRNGEILNAGSESLVTLNGATALTAGSSYWIVNILDTVPQGGEYLFQDL